MLTPAPTAPPAVEEPAASQAPSPTPTPSPAPTPQATPAEPAMPGDEPAPNTHLDRELGVGDVASLRTETSQTFDNGDGTFTTQFFSDPVFYQPDGAATFRKIDVGFEPTTEVDPLVDEVPAASSDEAPAVVSLFDTGEDSFVTVAHDGTSIGFGLPAASKGSAANEPVIDGIAADYADVWPGTDLRVLARPMGSKAFVVLHEIPETPSWTFTVDAPGLTLVARDDGTIDFVDAKGEAVAYIPHPYAVDSSVDELRGGGVVTDQATLSIGEDADGTPTLTISVDPAWLAKATYPVYVDPTTVFRSTNNTFDAFTSSANSGTNFGVYQRPTSPNYYEMWLGLDPSGSAGTNYVYVQWDVSSIAGSTIDAVTVGMHAYHQYYNAPTEVRSWIQRVNINSTNQWTESGIKWSNQPPVTGAGNIALIDSVEGVTATSNNTAGLRTAVQDWVSGTGGYNNGLRIWEDGNGSTYWKRIVASEDSDVNKRISLNVDWHSITVTDTTPKFTSAIDWDYSDGASHLQAKYQVQVATSQSNLLAGTTVAASGEVSSADTGWLITPGALTDLGLYWYRIRANDGSAWSAWSTPATFTYDGHQRGDESYYSRVPFDLAGGWTLDIGAHNGEAALSKSLFSIPSYGPPAELNLTYSSLGPTTTGMFGAGWRSNLTQYLTAQNGLVIWQRPDGGRVAFPDTAGPSPAHGGHYETLTRSGTEDTVKLKDQTKIVFTTSTGKLKRIENRFGKTLGVTWTASSATLTDASARTTSIAIDSANARITSVTDYANRTWSFGYTGTGTSSKLTSITDPLSKVTTFGYDATPRLTTISRVRSKAAGGTDTIAWTIGYTSGKATSVLDPIGTATSGSPAHLLSYSAGSTSAQLLKTYPATVVRNTTTYTLDPFGRATSILDPAGYTTKQTFDAKGNVLSLDSPIALTPTPVWATSTYTYDAQGNILTETEPEDGTDTLVTVMTYNTTNDLVTRSENDNWSSIKVITLNQYDGAGHLTAVIENCTSSGTTPPATASTCTAGGTHDGSTNLTTTYVYTANDQIDVEWNPRGYATKHQYDTHGNETSTIVNCTSSGTTAPTRATSCTAGGTQDASTNVATSAVYNLSTLGGKAGLPASQTDAVGNTTTYGYDGLGRQTSEVLPGDATIPVLTRTTAYDEFDQALTVTESWPGIAHNRVTTSVYDLRGRQTSETDPAGVASSTAYDAAGNETSSSSGGVTTTSVYDGVGNATTVTTGSGGDATSTTHTYDGRGEEVITAASGTTTTTTLDMRSRLTRAWITPTVPVDETQTFDHTGHTKVSRYVGGGYVQLGDTLVDRVGREVSVATGPVGSTLTSTTTFDANGNETARTAPAPTPGTGTLTTTTYDALDRSKDVIVNDVAGSSSVPDEDVTTTTYYDAAGNVVATKDPAGIVTRTFYNARGMAWKSIANCTDTGTTSPSNPATCTGAGTANAEYNVVTTMTFDGAGSVLTMTSPTASGTTVTANTYDNAGRLVSVVIDQGGLNLSTEFGYDSGGRQVAVNDPRGTISRTFYDTAGRVSKNIVNCTNTGTTVPTSNWDTCAGTGTADATWNVTTEFQYDARGNKDWEKAPNGRITTFAYDVADRLVSQTDNWVASPTQADQNLTTYFYYDDYGRQAAVKAPTLDRATFAVTRSKYDDQGRLTNQIRNCTSSGTTPPSDPATCTGGGTRDATWNLETVTAYDDDGNVIALTEPDPSATTGTGTVTTQYAYDDQDRLCRVVENATGTTNLQTLADPCSTATQTAGTATSNVSTRYTFDKAGNLLTMVDGRGNTTTYGYDTAGRMTSILDAAGKTLAWSYDVAGNRTSQTNRTPGQSVSWTYDKAGRMASRVANGVTVTYGYDAAGNPTSAGDGTRTISTTYDRLNRPLTVSTSDDAGAATSYTYHLTTPTWSDASGSYTATLDKFDRQVSVTDPIHPGSPFTTSYRADGQPATMAAPNGNTTAFGYDAAGQATTMTTTGTGGASRAAYTWTQNRAGNRLTENSVITGDTTNGTTDFRYDALGRLTTFTPVGISSQTTSWQAVPNRATLQVGGGTTVTTTFDAANRPTSDSAGGSYTSDNDGRLTARPGQTLTYDSLGRLLTVTVSSVTTTYTYDPLDRLRTVTRSGAVQRFQYVGRTTSAAQVLDASGTVIRSIANDWAGTRLVDWTGSGSNQRFYGTNGHHDVTWTADGTGAVTATLRYDPWGVLRASSGTSLPDFRFQGSWFDTNTDLSWVVTRWYAPALGRFTSEDTLLGQPNDPPSRHLYAYTKGDPIDGWDPDGRATAPAYHACGDGWYAPGRTVDGRVWWESGCKWVGVRFTLANCVGRYCDLVPKYRIKTCSSNCTYPSDDPTVWQLLDLTLTKKYGLPAACSTGQSGELVSKGAFRVFSGCRRRMAPDRIGSGNPWQIEAWFRYKAPHTSGGGRFWSPSITVKVTRRL